MPTLTVGFSKPKKWKPLAWMIMKGYSTPYSHVYIKLWSDKYQRFLIYQASHTLVNFMSTEVFDTESVVIEEFNLNIADETRTKMMQFAIDNAGKPYGMMNVVGLSVKRLCELFGMKIENPFTDGNKTYVCCELVGAILKDEIKVAVDIPLDDLDPKDIYDILKEFSKTPTNLQ
jgi:hypothetical protein